MKIGAPQVELTFVIPPMKQAEENRLMESRVPWNAFNQVSFARNIGKTSPLDER